MSELVDLEIAELSLVDRPANERSPLLLKGLDDDEENTVNELTQILLEAEAENEDALNETLKSRDISEQGRNALVGAYRLVNGHLDELPEEARKEFAEVALGLTLEDESDDDDVTKDIDDDIPEPVQKRLEELERRERDRVRKSFRRKADELALPVDKTRLADVLFKLSQENDDLFGEVEEMLKALSEQQRTDRLFGQMGTDKAGEPGGAYQKIQNKTEKKMESDGLDRPTALRKVLDENPDLAESYDGELTGGK